MPVPRNNRSRSRISTVGMSRRDVVKSMLFTGGALVFSGFGRPTQAVAQDKTRLVQWYHQYGEAGTEDAVRRYAAAYTKENPDVEIEVNWQLGDYGAALNAALLTDEAPDVFELGGPPTVDLLAQKQIADLDDIYTEDVKKDFHPTTLASCTIDGKLYAVKMIDDDGGVFYRKSILDDAGITPPDTLDAMIDAAKTLSSGRQKGLFVGNDGGIGALSGPLLWSSGGDFLNKDSTAPAFNTDRVASAFTRFGELVRGDALLIGSPTDYWDPSAFTQNLTVMQFTGIWAIPAINEALGDDYDVIPWPKSDDEGSPSSFWGGWYECVNGKTKNMDAAKAFVKWLWIDNTEFQEDWSLSYGFHVPARKSVAEAAEPLKSGPPAEMVKILYDYARITSSRWTAPMATAFSDAITNIMRNGADAKTELGKAEQTVISELKR